VTPRATPRLTAYAALAALGLIGALALRRPELAVVAAAIALVLGLGLTRSAPQVRVGFSVDEERALEGDDVHAELVLRAESGVDRLGWRSPCPAGSSRRLRPAAAVHLRRTTSVLPLRLQGRWGSWVDGDVRLRLGLLRGFAEAGRAAASAADPAARRGVAGCLARRDAHGDGEEGGPRA
jgi:uncharacterized protein (DUF58 family)